MNQIVSPLSIIILNEFKEVLGNQTLQDCLLKVVHKINSKQRVIGRLLESSVAIS